MAQSSARRRWRMATTSSARSGLAAARSSRASLEGGEPGSRGGGPGGNRIGRAAMLTGEDAQGQFGLQREHILDQSLDRGFLPLRVGRQAARRGAQIVERKADANLVEDTGSLVERMFAAFGQLRDVERRRQKQQRSDPLGHRSRNTGRAQPRAALFGDGSIARRQKSGQGRRQAANRRGKPRRLGG